MGTGCVQSLCYRAPPDPEPLGCLVRVLADESLRAGRLEFIWDGIDKHGRRVASGVYLYALRPERGQSQVKKMTLVK